MARILVVDDERMARTMVRRACEHLGHQVEEAASLMEAEVAAAHGHDLILLDVMLPDGDGLSRIQAFSAMPGAPHVLVITGYGHGDGAEQALRAGALDYITKPLYLPDLEKVLNKALAWREQRRGRIRAFQFDKLVGKSQALLEVFEAMGEAAASHVNVLIQGETGTGKDLVAQALHENSFRAEGPYVTLDCAALPPTLLSTQLFGHAKGAFTGADRSREGLLRAAHMGTLFLDEVGELPLEIQGNFLRALENRRFRPVGEKEEVYSDFRLVAATNKDIRHMAEEGLFRPDLFYRLQGIRIHLPPLRERKEDIPLLVSHFLTHAAQEMQTSPKLPDEDFMETLLAYPWPGNIRELRHTVQSAHVAAGSTPILHPHHLPKEIRIAVSQSRFSRVGSYSNVIHAHRQGDTSMAGSISSERSNSAPLPTLKECRAEAENHYLDRLLQQSRGDMTKAAKLAGVSRGHLYELMRKHGRTPGKH